MKILHLIKSLGRGGAEMLLPETIHVHDASSFEFHCIYFLPWKNQMVPELEAAGVQVTCMNASNNIKIISKARAIITYCKAYKIDLIHCHLPWAGFVGRVVHRLSGIPVVYTEHNKQERYNKITAKLNKLSFNWQSSVIAVSEDVAGSIQKNIHPSIPVRTILNGVNTLKFKRNNTAGLLLRRSLGIGDEEIVIGTLAVFRFQKRLKEWMWVIKELTKEFPELKAVMVGDGPLKEELMQERIALGLEDHLIMPGLQTNTVDWFSTMDMFMMSSVFEGLPIALLEAMSCETPVVSTNAGGIKEVIRHGVDGLLCDVDDWQNLAELCRLLIKDRKQKQQLAIQARQRVEDSFSLEYMVSELEQVYSSNQHTTIVNKSSAIV